MFLQFRRTIRAETRRRAETGIERRNVVRFGNSGGGSAMCGFTRHRWRLLSRGFAAPDAPSL